MTSFSSFKLLLAHVCYAMILDLVSGRLTWAALTGRPPPQHPNHPITAQETSMLTALPQIGDAVHKLHINRGLEAFSTPSRCDLVTRTDAPNPRPPLPPKLTLTQDESPTQKPESTLNSKSCHEDKFLFRYKCVFV